MGVWASGAVACTPDIPSGKFICSDSRDCPSGFACDLSAAVCVNGKTFAQTAPGTSLPDEAGSGDGAAATGGRIAAADGGMRLAPIAGRSGEQMPDAGRAMAPSSPSTAAGGGGGAPPAGAGAAAPRAGTSAPASCPNSSCGSACSDLNTDPENCGSCGHSCLGGSCGGARCQPIRLAGAGLLAEDLHVAEDGVYWTEREPGRLKKVGLNGGAVSVLASDVKMYELALDGSNVYAAGDAALFKVARAGGSATTLLADAGAFSVASDGSYVYLTGSEIALQRIPIGGGMPTPLAGMLGGSALKIDTQYVYWSSYDDGAIRKVSLSGGTPVTLASGLSYPVAIAVEAQYVYWADENDLNLMQLSTAGGTAKVFAADVTCTDIATDRDYVYWVDYVAQGRVLKRDAAGGPTITLADAQSAPISLDVDDKWVYWVNRGVEGELGEVRKVAK